MKSTHEKIDEIIEKSRDLGKETELIELAIDLIHCGIQELEAYQAAFSEISKNDKE